MKELRHLDLSHNCLEILPASIGEARKLVQLLLDGNKLQTLPGAVENLQTFLGWRGWIFRGGRERFRACVRTARLQGNGSPR